LLYFSNQIWLPDLQVYNWFKDLYFTAGKAMCAQNTSRNGKETSTEMGEVKPKVSKA